MPELAILSRIGCNGPVTAGLIYLYQNTRFYKYAGGIL